MGLSTKNWLEPYLRNRMHLVIKIFSHVSCSLTLALTLALMLTACSASMKRKSWNADLIKAEILLSNGKNNEAYSLTTKLLASAEHEKIYEEACILKGRIHADSGNLVAAVSTFRKLFNKTKDINTKAMCLYLTGRIFDEQADNKPMAEKFFLKTITAFPDSVSAERAFDWLVENRSMSSSKKEMIEFLKEKHRILAAGAMGDNVIFQAITIYRELNNKFSDLAALKLIEILEKNYPLSHFLNDSLLYKALILKKLNRPVDSIHTLRKLLSFREKSLFFGSYDTEHYVKAYFEIGCIEEDLGLMNEAVNSYLNLVEYFPESTLCDDALYKVAKIFEKKNDKKTSMIYLKKIADELSDSNYGKKAIEELKNASGH